jgi:hypothetical protein
VAGQLVDVLTGPMSRFGKDIGNPGSRLQLLCSDCQPTLKERGVTEYGSTADRE